MNIYKDHYRLYIESGLSVIPDKWKSKQPAIKGWTEYCFRLPTPDESQYWADTFKQSNIALCLGSASGIIALDLDATDQRVLDIILPVLPESPVVKKGAKGETRFFRYSGEPSQSISFNGEVVLEVLSTNRKTTLPPSVHPNGMSYTWTSNSLPYTDLPILPPMLLSHVESMIRLALPDLKNNGTNKLFSGRNQALSSYCAKLIQQRVPLNEAIKSLINKDKETDDEPLFTDHRKLRHTDAITNALQFYANHLSTINSRHFQKKETYETPIIGDITLPKTQGQGLNENCLSSAALSVKPNLTLPKASGTLGKLIENIRANMYIDQPEFAYAAAFVILSGLTSRKMLYSNLSPNIYTLILGGSGCGKNAPLQYVKRLFVNIGAEKFLGSGDFVSDASLIDSLQTKPVRVDVIDEASKLLAVANGGKNGYDGKMADILCELYTTSNDKFLGRAMANSNGEMSTRGSCYRPNVNMIAGTTPSGFSWSVTPKSLEKGLLSRFMVFLASKEEQINIVDREVPLDRQTLEHLKWLADYVPPNSTNLIGEISQGIYILPITDSARERLGEIFNDINMLRKNTSQSSAMLPVISRMYQQMLKIAIIHAAGRSIKREPTLELEDISFSYAVIQYLYSNMSYIVDTFLFSNANERHTKALYRIISENKNISKPKLIQLTLALTNKEREESLKTLCESGQITINIDEVTKGFIYEAR